MFEGKAAADGKTADAADVAEVDVQRISVEPNMCPLENNLRLEMDFTVSADVAEAHWEIKVGWVGWPCCDSCFFPTRRMRKQTTSP